MLAINIDTDAEYCIILQKPSQKHTYIIFLRTFVARGRLHKSFEFAILIMNFKFLL